ncbi:MFS transporter [Saccharothrix variisporea]|uniref:Putative MFS family arabinose efflux permease n=1 Tax=Saccharothrix variisporea TaxID=543527 RepID=A0A495X9N4_9PSEU|nr:MFS transporter [Saccharothrix variisporea]RKT68248.1 putative MFS family arabinose efflux permease [Saccharothrix variisporea]
MTRPFLLLWFGQSVSLVGSQVTALALPLVAALTLGAGPWEMGLLAACARAPYLVLGLPAGVWVDRLPRRPLLVACALGQAVALAVVPLADVTGVLSVPLLCGVALVAGAFAVFGDIGTLALVPLVVPAERLTRAQGAFETSQSTAQIAGPALAGWLVAVVGAPVALLADALSFLVSAATLAGIRVRDRLDRVGGVLDGVRLVFGQALLRRVTLCTATHVFWVNAFLALLPLHLAREGLSPGRIGVTLAIGAAGGLVGALIAPRLGERVMPVAVAVAGVGAAGVVWHPLVIAVMWFGVQVYHVLQVPVRYRLTPPELHGRVNAAIRTTVWGSAPLGALLGGVLAETAGLAPALVVSGAGAGLACLWLVRG